MSLIAERPDVLERVGAAMSSSDLSPVEGRIGAVELIAALAYAQINPDASEHGEHDAAVIDPRTELAAVLVRLKYAGDRTLGDRAVVLLAEWMRHQKAPGRWKIESWRDGHLSAFVSQTLAEWLFPVCQVCSGREMLGLERGTLVERRIRCKACSGSGTVFASRKSKASGRAYTLTMSCIRCGGKGWRTWQRVKASKPRTCYSCLGSGRHRPNDSERAKVLALDHRVYERWWVPRFTWLEAGLDRLDHLVKRCLQAQMRML